MRSFTRVMVREDFLEERTGELSFWRDTYNQVGRVVWGGGCKGLSVWTIGGATDAARKGGQVKRAVATSPRPVPRGCRAGGRGQGGDMFRVEL